MFPAAVPSQSPARALIFSHSGLDCTVENFISGSALPGFSACAPHLPTIPSTITSAKTLLIILITDPRTHTFCRRVCYPRVTISASTLTEYLAYSQPTKCLRHPAD